MILDRVLGNLKELDSSLEDKNYHIEKLFLESSDLLKSVIRITSDHGKEYGIRMPKDSKPLRVGDIMHQDGNNLVVIDVKQDDVLIISPKDLTQMGTVAHSLGNKHLPIQIIEEKIIIAYDSVVESSLIQDNVCFVRTSMKLQNAFKHSTHHH